MFFLCLSLNLFLMANVSIGSIQCCVNHLVYLASHEQLKIFFFREISYFCLKIWDFFLVVSLKEFFDD